LLFVRSGAGQYIEYYRAVDTALDKLIGLIESIEVGATGRLGIIITFTGSDTAEESEKLQ